MEQIKSLNELSSMISAQWKKGVLTNGSFSIDPYRKAVEEGALYAIQWPHGLLLLREKIECYVLNFYLQPDGNLDGIMLPSPVVLEIAARQKDTELMASQTLWEQLGFRQLFLRQRMNWMGKGVADSFLEMEIKEAEVEDAPYLMEHLLRNFDSKTACLPSMAELMEDIENKNLLLAHGKEGERMGALRLQRKGNIKEVRQIFVDSNHRKKGVASALLNALEGACRIWVRTDNLPAMSLYQKLGFKEDGWKSAVLIYQKEKNK